MSRELTAILSMLWDDRQRYMNKEYVVSCSKSGMLTFVLDITLPPTKKLRPHLPIIDDVRACVRSFTTNL